LKYNVDLLKDDVPLTKFNILLNMCMNDDDTQIGRLVTFRQETFVHPKGKKDPKITNAKRAQQQARTHWQKLADKEMNIQKFMEMGG
ncbi:MAG: hypothetical protein ACRC1D_01005, partial [Culicoidibacterales bacterium]